MSNQMVMNIDTVERQRNYVEQQRKQGDGLGVVFADAFLRGMRDLGYKNPAWAIAEQVDNSFQAGANVVSIRFSMAPPQKGPEKPEQIAVCDDGNGMIPDMIGYAVRWGGTDREGDRKGFGRYGYGLPSSAVSIAKRYTVYSKVRGGDWHAVTVDIDELAAAANDLQKTRLLLTAVPAKPPAWIATSPSKRDTLDVSTAESGTVIVFEDMDRLSRLTGWIARKTLRSKLLQHFGVIYRHWIPDKRIFIDGIEAEVVDPLFLMEHGRHFDATSVRGERIESRTIEVTTPGGTIGKVTIRAAYLPPNFQLEDPRDYGRKGARTLKGRHEIMKEYNGLLICRERRQIDCVQPAWTKFQNYDMNVKVEVDFDAELDEFFGITTAKQQIVIEDEMWQKLQHSGTGGGALIDLVVDIRNRFEQDRKRLKAAFKNAEQEEPDSPTSSEKAMEDSEKFKATQDDPSPEQKAQGKRRLDDAAKDRADKTGESEDEAREQVEAQAKKHRFKVEFASIPEGPFYRPDRLGEQKRLIINTDHPFFVKVYDGPADPAVQSALEVLLFVLAEGELDAKGDTETFYKAQRQRWSQRLRHALDALVSDESIEDAASSIAEALHTAPQR